MNESEVKNGTGLNSKILNEKIQLHLKNTDNFKRLKMVAILTVWESDYGVASVDTNSLILITYVKFAKIQCTIKYGRNPLFYNIPKLNIEEDSNVKEYVGFHQIWNYYREKVFDIDHFMSDEQMSESHAYINYINKSLLPGICITMWVDTQNYLEVTRKWYRSALTFPINIWYPYNINHKVTEYVKVLIPEENLEDYSYVLIDEAKKCINDLSVKLGSKNYFFGNDPSSLDAVMYGYLAPLLNVPIPVPELQTYLKEHDNLLKFIKRVATGFFSQQKLEYKYVEKLHADEDSQDFKTPPRTIAIATFFVATAMITYGMINGIIKMPSGCS